MEKTSDSPAQQNGNLVCPITLDVYRDPVLATDGHVYERTAIVRWIQQQGTSPLTREPLAVRDLRSEETLKQICQPYRSNSVTCSRETNIVSLPSLTTTQSDTRTTRRTLCKQYCTVKRTLFIIIAVSFIVSPFIIATSIIFFLVRSTSISATPTFNKYPNNDTYPLTTYKLPNNCTLPNIVPLFSWNNVQRFNYTYYSKVYNATSIRTIITFAFRHDPSYWCLDSVSVVDISLNTELITNGGFENNPSNGFIRCNSYANSSTTLLLPSPHPYNGKRSFCDDTIGLPDYLNQRLHTKVGQLYHVSFWLQNMGDAPNSAQVIMSY